MPPILASPIFEKKHSMPASRRKTVTTNLEEMEFYRRTKEDSKKKSENIRKLAPLGGQSDQVEELQEEEIVSPVAKRGLKMFVDIDDILAKENTPSDSDQSPNLQLLHLAEVKNNNPIPGPEEDDYVIQPTVKLGKTC